MIVGIIGIGCIGSGIKKSFEINEIKTVTYDKYKESDNFEKCLNTSFIFLCLPTLLDKSTNEYDKSNILELCEKLYNNNYTGIILIKSTVEPFTTSNISKKFPSLKLIHNPEFCSSNTAFEDFHNQKHIVLGNCNLKDKELLMLKGFYKIFYKNAEISVCTSNESESMKLFCNSFYALKIQFFNELYFLCEKKDLDFNNIRDLMLKNGWINPMHTNVPGSDGKFSYGGRCFPKDIKALLNYMEENNSYRKLLESCIQERESIRNIS
jgi:UDPglucose 6-dehydrogenase